MAFFLHFFRQQFKTLPSVDSFRVNLSGRTVVVVGSNTGLGLEAARHLATLMGGPEDGGRLILACRNVQKGEEALICTNYLHLILHRLTDGYHFTAIKASSGFPHIEVWEVDLANFSSIKAFADQFEIGGGDRLNILIMNSGITTFDYSQTTDGWESQ